MWREIPGRPGYEASREGEIRSVDRIITRKGKPARLRGRVLAQFAHPLTGHRTVRMPGGSPKVHHLVLETFDGPRPFPRAEGLHWDDDPANNRIENLRWGTRSENQLDAVRNGRHAEAKRTECPQGHEYDRVTPGGARRCSRCDADGALRRKTA